jgi:alkylation response protein AidB-like acyl-CoA dehydrogenase
VDFNETSEQRMLREAVAKLAADFGREYYTAKVRSGAKTTELWEAVAKAGYVGVCLPEEYGGGMGISELAVVAEELAANGCPLLLLMVTPAITGTLIARFGTPAQRERWLPPNPRRQRLRHRVRPGQDVAGHPRAAHRAGEP